MKGLYYLHERLGFVKLVHEVVIVKNLADLAEYAIQLYFSMIWS